MYNKANWVGKTQDDLFSIYMKEGSMAVFVLVPGGYGGSWIWREVARSLWAAGHEAYAPSLTGLGERAHLAQPDIDLSTHITDVVAEITYSDLTNVYLVGYSLGGVVATGVAEQIPERIACLVYLDALVPKDGESAADLFGPEATEMIIQAVDAYGDGWKILPGPALTDKYPKFTPQPLKTGLEKVSLKNPLAAKLPRAFIYCPLNKTGEDPAHINIAKTANEVKNDPAWRYFEIQADHLVILEEPHKVTEVLLELVMED
jgi:pimeloyl-ACP methyl ester carboxylesterase